MTHEMFHIFFPVNEQQIDLKKGANHTYDQEIIQMKQQRCQCSVRTVLTPKPNNIIYYIVTLFKTRMPINKLKLTYSEEFVHFFLLALFFTSLAQKQNTIILSKTWFSTF